MVRFCKLLAQLDMPGEAASRYAQYAGLTAQARSLSPPPSSSPPPLSPPFLAARGGRSWRGAQTAGEAELAKLRQQLARVRGSMAHRGVLP